MSDDAMRVAWEDLWRERALFGVGNPDMRMWIDREQNTLQVRNENGEELYAATVSTDQLPLLIALANDTLPDGKALFTRQDVRRLREAARYLKRHDLFEAEKLQSFADKLAALLPPE